MTVSEQEAAAYQLIFSGATMTDASSESNRLAFFCGDADTSLDRLDEFYFNTDGTGITVDKHDLNLDGTKVAYIDGGKWGSTLFLLFEAGVTVTQKNRLLQNILWRNNANTPPAQRTIYAQVRYGTGGGNPDTVLASGSLVVNITASNSAPRNRTSTVMTELDLSAVHDVYQDLDGWTIARYPTKSFTNASYDGSTRIQTVTDDDTSESFHGYKYFAGDATKASVQMYVPSKWSGVSGEVRCGLWIDAYTDAGALVSYPIVMVQQKAGASAPSTARFWDENKGDWEDKDLPADVKLDSWMTMTVSMADGTATISLTGTRTSGGSFSLSHSVTAATATNLRELWLATKVAATGEEYTTYWDNLTWNTGDASTSQVWTTITTQKDVRVPISGLQVADVDAGDTLTTVFTTSEGALYATGSGATISGSGSGRLSIQGTVSQINAALAYLSFTQTSTLSSGSIYVTTTDAGGLSDTDTITFNLSYSDNDSDNIIDNIEDQVTSYDSSDDSSDDSGDGNGDGTADRLQDNVTSLYIADASRMLTVASSDNKPLTKVEALPASSAEKGANGFTPTSLYGLLSLKISGLSSGQTVTMTIYMDKDTSIKGCWKMNRYTNNWDNIATIIRHSGNKTIITFDLTEGGAYDTDSSSQTITDPFNLSSDSTGGGTSIEVPTLRIF